eukprot:12370207-Alexandrium_andersonii.AAC.1
MCIRDSLLPAPQHAWGCTRAQYGQLRAMHRRAERTARTQCSRTKAPAHADTHRHAGARANMIAITIATVHTPLALALTPARRHRCTDALALACPT